MLIFVHISFYRLVVPASQGKELWHQEVAWLVEVTRPWSITAMCEEQVCKAEKWYLVVQGEERNDYLTSCNSSKGKGEIKPTSSHLLT